MIELDQVEFPRNEDGLHYERECWDARLNQALMLALHSTTAKD